MALDPDFRIKIRDFFRKHGKLIAIIVIVFALVVAINRMLVSNKRPDSPTTTYTPHTAVLDSTDGTSEEVPTKVADSFESFIEKYIKYCNNHDFVDAYNLISDDCRKNFFGDSYNNFVNYVSEKFDSTKAYAIQSYSNYNDKYVYSVKLYDNFLATGLTNQSYRYVEEKMAVSYDENNNIVFSVGNYMESKNLQYQTSNDYLKAEVTKSIEKYSYVIYNLKLTNRSNYTIVIKDGNTDEDEVYLNVGDERRNCLDTDTTIVLKPGETTEVAVSFTKFYDSSEIANSLVLNAVRVMENYTGNSETAEEEINNAIYKASMTISMN